MADDFYAHSLPDRPVEDWERLEDHLNNVADRAAGFAAAFGASEWGRLAGLWHDLGKYLPEFQERLRGSSIRVDHAGPGAAAAWSLGQCGLPLAYVIAAHHTGLANSAASAETSDENCRQQPLVERLAQQKSAWERLEFSLPKEVWPHDLPPFPITPRSSNRHAVEEAKRALELWTRMLFSALVDADYLETERFYDGTIAEQRARYESIEVLQQRLDKHLARFKADTPVNKIRCNILSDCRRAATEPPGVFSLTVPTGGGKTLSGLAFALEHARRHGLRRVVIAIPYTSIIEQTARVYRSILGDANVIEHHSNVETQTRRQQDAELEDRRRLATENWDAPIIVTTNVQLLESLLANQPSRCRKLHNLARAVIVLDEAQCLPLDMASTVAEVLNQLATRYGSTIVLSTATQPALKQREKFPLGLQHVREIVADPNALAKSLKRVQVRWPAEPTIVPADYTDVAREIAAHARVLAIVHRRVDARELAQLLPDEGLYHLSALMCPAHRRRVLSEVRQRLQQQDGAPLRLVATQLIEAGVDVDFPVVYRALAGLDSIAQAAGRCDREGHLTAAAGQPAGQVVIFRAPSPPPPGSLRHGMETTLSMLSETDGVLDLSDPALLESYFRRLYFKTTERAGLQAARTGLNYATTASLSRLIEDGFSTPLFVPYRDDHYDSDEVLAAFRRAMNSETFRALQPYLVQIRPLDRQRLDQLGGIERVNECLDVLSPLCANLYDPRFGLMIDEESKNNQSAYVL